MLRVLLDRHTASRTDTPGLPFRVRVGVTGHRELDDRQSVVSRVGRVLDVIQTQVLAHSSATPVTFTVVSALAEGADRLVADVVLDRERAELEVVLPLECADFLQDFESAVSRQEFLDLLGRATLPPFEPERPQQRPEAYVTGGYELVDRVDVLIAVWDGEPARGPGGTGSVVDYARAQKVPTFIISTVDPNRTDFPAFPNETRPGRVYRTLDHLDLRLGKTHEPSQLERVRDSFDQLDRFNREKLDPERVMAAADMERAYSAPAAHGYGFPVAFADWALPLFVRADQLATHYQRIYTRRAFLVLMLAALAVTIAAAQEIYFRKQPKLSLVEVLLMALIVAFVVFVRWKRPHERWVSYRSLAENLRSAPFIALLGVGDGEGRLDAAKLEVERARESVSEMEARRALEREAFVPWFQRAFTEIWKQQPHRVDIPGDATRLRGFFLEAWIDGQITYHRKTANLFDLKHRRLTRMIYALFLGTLVAALIHAFEWIDTRTLVFLAIMLPAFGAALSGYRELRQFALHAGRYGSAKERLEHVKTRMKFETRADAIRARARSAYSIMLEENLDWFGVLEFQDLDIVT
jgi:hypothetical protein